MRATALFAALSLIALSACSDNGDGNAQAGEDIGSTAAENADQGAPSTSGRELVAAPENSLAGEPMVLGDPDAPVTLIEYASSTCPACARFNAVLMPQIKEQYIDTGKIRFEYREFPTNPRNLAYAGFYLARCAATNRGAPAYFAMLDTLYERQREWAYGNEPGAVLQSIAAQAGIDRQGLEQCFYREDVRTAVSDNVELGQSQGVRATPTLMIDGEILQWNSEESLMAALEEAVAAAQ